MPILTKPACWLVLRSFKVMTNRRPDCEVRSSSRRFTSTHPRDEKTDQQSDNSGTDREPAVKPIGGCHKRVIDSVAREMQRDNGPFAIIAGQSRGPAQRPIQFPAACQREMGVSTAERDCGPIVGVE